MNSTDTPILEARGVGVHFGGLAALADFSLALRPRELVGLIGPNGAGKTTAFNVITGVVRPTSGEIFVGGVRANGLKPHRICALGVSRTFQNIRLFHGLSVLDNVRIGFHHGARSTWLGALLRTPGFLREEAELERMARHLLDGFGLAGRSGELARNLPYGQQRRLEIARALASGPRILLLDEPAAGMNSSEKRELLASIRRIREDFGVAILLIEHDMRLVMNVCERLLVLDHGVRIAEGRPDEVRRDPKVIAAYLGADHPALTAEPEGRSQEEGLFARSACPSIGPAVGLGARRMGLAEPEGRSQTERPLFRAERVSVDRSRRPTEGRGDAVIAEATAHPAPVLAVEDLHVRYGAIHALKDVSLEVLPGEVVALIGANGAGKTTTLRAVGGVLKPAAGRVRLLGEDVTGWPAERLVGRGLAHAPEGRGIFANLTVRENLLLGAYLRRDKDGIRADFERALEVFPILAERAAQLAGTLSGGEQQMLAVARAMMGRPKVLLLDEPSLGLAPQVVETIFRTLAEIHRSGVSILLVEQNAAKALGLADRGYVLETGQVAMQGRGAELLASAEVRRAYLGESP